MHNCSNCGGCGRDLTLTEPEIQMLQTLAQIPFLPIARTAADPSPVYLEDTRHSAAEYSLILQCLEKKGLISLDYDSPLKGCDLSHYAGYPILGSMALTARGQSVIELLDLQGIQ